MSHDNPAKSSEPRWGDSRDREAISERPKQGETPTIRQIIDRSSHCTVEDCTGKVHSAVKAKISDLRLVERELAQMAAQKAELEAKLAEEQKDALCWKRLAERHYAARAYPANQHLAEGSLDAYFKAHRDEILAAERKEGKP